MILHLRSHLYEIPITARPLPSRKNIRGVASDSRSNKVKQFALLMQIKIDASRVRIDQCVVFRLPLRSMQMMDLIMLAIGLAFFALSVGYTIACDRL